MIQKMEVAGVHLDVEPKLLKYTTKKLGNLDKYMPRHARESAHLVVKLKQEGGKDKGNTCEVILNLPNDTIRISETTINMYSAVDIIETKLKNQIKKYKETHTNRRLPAKIAAKIRSRKQI